MVRSHITSQPRSATQQLTAHRPSLLQIWMPPARWPSSPSASVTPVSLSLWCCASMTDVTMSLSVTETSWTHPQRPSLLEATRSLWYTNEDSLSQPSILYANWNCKTDQATWQHITDNTSVQSNRLWMKVWQNNFVFICTWHSLLTDSWTGLSLQMNPLTCNCLQRFKCFFKVDGDSSCRIIHCWWCTVCWTCRVLMQQCTTCGKNAAFKTFQFLSSFFHFKSRQMKSTGWNRSSIKGGGNCLGAVAHWMVLTHQNYHHETINSILPSGSVCHHWDHDILCSSLLFKNMKIKIHNYNFACSFKWVWNLVCHFKGSTWAEGVGE